MQTAKAQIPVSGSNSIDTTYTSLTKVEGAFVALNINPSSARTLFGLKALPHVDFDGTDNGTINGFDTIGNSLKVTITSTLSTTSYIINNLFGK